MKVFDINWSEFLDAVSKWQALDVVARRCYLHEVKSTALIPDKFLGANTAPLLKARFLIPSPTVPGKVKLNPAYQVFQRVMCVIARLPLFESEQPHTLLNSYLSEHFTYEQRRYMFYGYGHTNQVQDIVTAAKWIQDFLALSPKGVAHWERQHGDYIGHKARFSTPDLPATANRLLRTLIAHDGPIEFSKLDQLLPEIPPPIWSGVIPACLNYMLLFAAVRKTDLEPMLGIWPPILRYLNRPAPVAPALVEPRQTFQAELLTQDMTTILALCHAQPMRVRAHDQQLFAKACTLIEDHLVGLPEWLTSLDPFASSERLRFAQDVLYDLLFTAIKGNSGRNYHMEVTKKGLEWLALTSGQRVKFLVDLLEKHQGSLTAHGRERRTWLRVTSRFWLDKKDKKTLMAALTQAFHQLGTEGFRDLEAFIHYQSIEANPLKEGQEAEALRQIFLSWGSHHRSEEQLERTWKVCLFDYALRRLAYLGGVKLGYTRNKRLCIALTALGQYHLGMIETFDVPAQVTTQEVIVQPNFDVVFLGPCASAEAEMGRFCQRVGKGTGTLFKITKASILQAAEVGLTAKQVLTTLETIATKPVPANISREITGWFESCRQVRVKSTILIHCPDEETAMKVKSLGKRDVTPLTSNILELSSAKAKKTLIGKLRKQGIFLS